MPVELVVFSLALLIDTSMGDPTWLPHPVRFLGHIIQLEEKVRGRIKGKNGQQWTGFLLVVATLVITYACGYWIIKYAFLLDRWVGIIVAAWLLSTTFAANGLRQVGLEIYNLLMIGDVEQSRKKVGWIVGRDTANLSTEEIIRATVETVAENIVDGIIAPLFYFLLGGVPLALTYRAVNTFDSMWGYKDEKFLNFGWAAARIDDLFNYVPARLTGIFLLTAAWLARFNVKEAWRAIKEDAWQHPSPNSGIPEAAVAGALEIRLGGINYYQGVPSFRAYMGKPIRNLEPKCIVETVKLMYLTLFSFCLLAFLVLW